jgi:membrane protein implicated in regulation of membrane protease activity
MPQTAPLVLAVGAGALMVLAVVLMTGGNLLAAGMSFLSASIVLYLRETQFKQGPADN